MFNEWRTRFQQRCNTFGSKNKAIAWMWNIKVRDAQKDIQRAFNIWKGSTNFDK